MSDILDEASALVQCRQCPWYKSCVTPMRFSPEDLRRQMPSSFAMDDSSMPKYLAELAAATQNFLLEGCPIFIERLRSNPALAQRIKQMMHNWASEREASSPE